jgi:hypothetical protein
LGVFLVNKFLNPELIDRESIRIYYKLTNENIYVMIFISPILLVI